MNDDRHESILKIGRTSIKRDDDDEQKRGKYEGTKLFTRERNIERG